MVDSHHSNGVALAAASSFFQRNSSVIILQSTHQPGCFLRKYTRRNRKNSLIVLLFILRETLSIAKETPPPSHRGGNCLGESQLSIGFISNAVVQLPMCEHGGNKTEPTANRNMGVSWRDSRWAHTQTHTHTAPPDPFGRSLVSTVTEDKKGGPGTAGL